jgi:hypothetical protein
METLDEKIIICWNKMAEKYGLAKVKLMTPKRKQRLSACIKEVPSLADWIKIIQEVPKNEFNIGHNDRKWTANIDWLLNTNCNYAKLLEKAEERGEPVKRENSQVASRFNTDAGYKPTVNGAKEKDVTRKLGNILQDLLSS